MTTHRRRTSLHVSSGLIGGLCALQLGCEPNDSEVLYGRSELVLETYAEASALLAPRVNDTVIVVSASDGLVSAIDPRTRQVRWSTNVPTAEGDYAYIRSTPVVVAGRVVVGYKTISPGSSADVDFRVAVLGVEDGRIDGGFPPLVLSAEKPAADGEGRVQFYHVTATSTAALVHAPNPPHELGVVYMSFGSSGDIQPWHGWVFEIDLDAWLQDGAESAVSAVLLTTREASCPIEGQSGAQEMICGGGVWTPAGPQVYETADGFEVLIPTGNGSLDISRGDYANALMRVGMGLVFEPQCDERLCARFDQRDPSRACIESCRNLFIPRLMPDDPPLRPGSGRCDDATFMECYALLDLDLGANAPVKLSLEGGPSVFVLPGKDGAVYLIDAEQMGILYDREQLVQMPACADDDECMSDFWRGMIVTHPAVAYVDGRPTVLIPTFSFDRSSPAGLVALAVVVDGGEPRFQRLWEAPDFASSEALERFRDYPSRVLMTGLGDEAVGWLVESGAGTGEGMLLGVRVRDGRIIARISLQGTGQRFVLPIHYEGTLFVQSSRGLEAYQLSS